VYCTLYSLVTVHCKKELAVFPSPAGMSLFKLFLGGNNLVFSRPERVWSVTSRLGTGKWLTLFYSVQTVRPIYLGKACEVGLSIGQTMIQFPFLNPFSPGRDTAISSYKINSEQNSKPMSS
jgi:hypothetical protein